MSAHPARSVAFVTLGCPKNEVDSEVAAAAVARSGWELVSDPASAGFVVINTCGFIRDAVEESIEMILALAEETDAVIVVYGCLSARYKKELYDTLPEVDLYIEGHDHTGLPGLLARMEQKRRRLRIARKTAPDLYQSGERFTSPGVSVYVKIAEGCSRRCSFCTIPGIRGRMRSRPIDSIVAEVRALTMEGGAKEIILVAQDTSAYGRDLGYEAGALPALLVKLEAIEADFRIRILYLHPAGITSGLIEILAGSRKICRCLDVPFQHSSTRILAAMRRGHGKAPPDAIAERLRRYLSGWALRTSIIVGFPGETRSDFDGLLDFLRQFRFERLGAFRFSPEEGTSAASLSGQVSDRVSSGRFDELMSLQRRISTEINLKTVGRTLRVLASDGWSGRTEADAPEIDQAVHIISGSMMPGEFNMIRITASSAYDLYGELADED